MVKKNFYNRSIYLIFVILTVAFARTGYNTPYYVFTGLVGVVAFMDIVEAIRNARK